MNSKLVEEVAILAESLREAEGKGNLGHTAVHLLREFREATVPDHAVGENVAEDEALAVLGVCLGLKEAEDLLGLCVITEYGRGKAEGHLLLIRGLGLQVKRLLTCNLSVRIFARMRDGKSRR